MSTGILRYVHHYAGDLDSKEEHNEKYEHPSGSLIHGM